MKKVKLYWLQFPNIPQFRIQNAQSLEECEKAKESYPGIHQVNLEIVDTHKIAKVMYAMTQLTNDGDFPFQFYESKEIAIKELEEEKEKTGDKNLILTEHIIMDTLEDEIPTIA